MKIFVKVKTNAKNDSVVRKDATHFEVSVKKPPVGGLANEAIIKNLAEYLETPKSLIKIVRGHKSKQKIVEIN